jgi:hypothetical protein
MLTNLIAVAGLIGALACPPPQNHEEAHPWYRTEWRASTFTAGAQAEAAIGCDRLGNFTIAWSSRRQQTGRSGVYMQQVSCDGRPIGGETALSLWNRSHQRAPVVGSSRAGVTWIAWQSHGQDGHGESIVARRFRASTSGELLGGSEILVNQEWIGDQTNPVVAVSPEGDAMIAWTGIAASTGQPRVRARVFGADGQAASEDLSMSTEDQRVETSPTITFCTDGSFVLVFAVADADARPAGLRMRMFDACGRAMGQEMGVPEAQRGAVEPVIASASFGYIVAWHEPSSSNDGDYSIVGVRLNHAGHRLGQPFLVNSQTMGHQNAAAIAVAVDDRFTIMWNSSHGERVDVTAQMFAADGGRIGGPFQVNVHEGGEQRLRAGVATCRAIFAPSGELACAWSGDGGFGDSSAAHVTLLSSAPLNGDDQPRGVTADMIVAASERSADANNLPQPHQPPTFDPSQIDEGRREVIEGAGIGFTGIFNTGWTPPDPHLAVGSNQLVAMTNGKIAFFSKTGTLLFEDEIEGPNGFWGTLGATGFVFDPETLYDPLSQRFFAMASEANAPGSKSYILIAVSDDSNPTGSWHKYRIETTALAGVTYDSPNIAVDADVVYISGDRSGAVGYPVYTFDKPSLLAGAPPAVMRSVLMPTTVGSAGMPPVSFDDPPALYLIEHKEAANNTSVRLIALTDPLGTPTFTSFTLTVPSYGPPEDPPQMGTTVRPETFDSRFWSAAYRNGSLWATHHISNTRVLARWYQIAMNGWPSSGQNPALVQSGNIDPGATIRTFFSAITADAAGNAAIVFAQSSPTQFIDMRTAYRYASDPLGTFQTPVLRKTSNGPYGTARWGDYAGIGVDPSDGHTMWAEHEFHTSGSWQTWIQSFYPGPPPCAVDVTGDGVVDVDDLIALINSWGPCIGCTADVTGNGVVNIDDLLAVINAWGPCT